MRKKRSDSASLRQNTVVENEINSAHKKFSIVDFLVKFMESLKKKKKNVQAPEIWK